MNQAVAECIDVLVGVSIDPRYFRGDSRFSLIASDYRVRGARRDRSESKPQLLWDPKGEYGLVLSAQRAQRLVDIALLTFWAQEALAEVVQVQGAKGCYRELTPVSFAPALISRVVQVGREAALEVVRVLPADEVNGWEGENSEKLRTRYDAAASRCGFRYSQQDHRWVLDLKAL